MHLPVCSVGRMTLCGLTQQLTGTSVSLCAVSRHVLKNCEDTIVWGQLAGCRGTGVILVCLIREKAQLMHSVPVGEEQQHMQFAQELE